MAQVERSRGLKSFLYGLDVQLEVDVKEWRAQSYLSYLIQDLDIDVTIEYACRSQHSFLDAWKLHIVLLSYVNKSDSWLYYNFLVSLGFLQTILSKTSTQAS